MNYFISYFASELHYSGLCLLGVRAAVFFTLFIISKLSVSYYKRAKPKRR